MILSVVDMGMCWTTPPLSLSFNGNVPNYVYDLEGTTELRLRVHENLFICMCKHATLQTCMNICVCVCVCVSVKLCCSCETLCKYIAASGNQESWVLHPSAVIQVIALSVRLITVFCIWSHSACPFVFRSPFAVLCRVPACINVSRPPYRRLIYEFHPGLSLLPPEGSIDGPICRLQENRLMSTNIMNILLTTCGPQHLRYR